MNASSGSIGCGAIEHQIHRRAMLKLAGCSGISWLTPLATGLARAAEQDKTRRAKSLIVLWMEGAPSQLETFDPHPGTEIAAGSLARDTRSPGIQIGIGLEQIADQMDVISLVRAVVSKEGDHARAIYNIKTGFRPDPTLVHPSVGSVICHQRPDSHGQIVDIPRHISILPQSAPGRGGYLGDVFDAFKIGDPRQPIPDVRAQVAADRHGHRIRDLQTVDRLFLNRHQSNQTVQGSLGHFNLQAALNMMSSAQLDAFDVSKVPLSLQQEYGDTPFGRGCLAAVRLIERGVRCVEVTLGGWDTHINNHELQAKRIAILDPALAAMIRDLKNRDLLDSTLVVCAGEFGRTPWLNAAGGRDHWPHGFSVALAGGGIRGGRIVGQTSPTPKKDSQNRNSELKDPHAVEDIHATILHLLGIDYELELDTPIGRPMIISQGHKINALIS